MGFQATTQDAYKLLHDGTVALSKVECNGIRIDTDYLDKAITKTTKKIKRLERRMESSDVMKAWRKRFGHKTNTESGQQLGRILFDDLGYEHQGISEKSEQYLTDEKSLSKVDDPFISDYLQVKKFRKALSTNLLGLKKEIVDGFVRPFFSLNLVTTFRSSSNSPNFQNIPLHLEDIGPLVRKAFVARKGNHLVELDYSGIEVRIAACYHLDPVMLQYIKDTTKDMHRDMAMECYKLALAEVTKDIRYVAKNRFVFPQFYGDWYVDCARNLWTAMEEMSLITASGTNLKKHLRQKGIIKMGACMPGESPKEGTFEKHIQQVERSFWEDRFCKYALWKKQWYEKYKKRGWFQSLTGFTYQGYLKRNEVINYPVQGSAFHCLLWSLTQLVNKELKRHKMKSLIVGQIHDSIVADVPANELDDFLVLANRVMSQDVVEHWPWIVVPLDVEAEVVPIGGSWIDKKEMKIPA